VPTDIQEPPRGWAELRRLDTRANAGLTLSRWPSSPQFWVLEQAGTPVGMIKRVGASTRVAHGLRGVACPSVPMPPASRMAPSIHGGGWARACPLLPPAHTAGRRIARPCGWAPLTVKAGRKVDHPRRLKSRVFLNGAGGPVFSRRRQLQAAQPSAARRLDGDRLGGGEIGRIAFRGGKSAKTGGRRSASASKLTMNRSWWWCS
jgi:hypothetical protein